MRFGEDVRVNIAKNIIDAQCVLEVLAPAAGKWNAARNLAARHGIAREEVVGIGDNYNDIDLISEAGCGVAMGNAVDELKAVADRIAADNDNHGLHGVLKELFE